MEKASFDELVELMRHLRSPEGCPWDREQTLESLRKYILEEAREVVEAIDGLGSDGSVEAAAHLRDELGDLLLECLFVAQLASEAAMFDVYDSLGALKDKLVRRHPHVFGDVKLSTAEEVLESWNRIKEIEGEGHSHPYREEK
jgi:uncharacterized protein YabN with tetrapyrrole methylase and pyrophosphatase domain